MFQSRPPALVFLFFLLYKMKRTLWTLYTRISYKKSEANKSMRKSRKTAFHNKNLSKSRRVRVLVSLNELWGHRLALIYQELATQRILLTIEFYLTECVNNNRRSIVSLCIFICENILMLKNWICFDFWQLIFTLLSKTEWNRWCYLRYYVLNIIFIFHWISPSNQFVFLFEEWRAA